MTIYFITNKQHFNTLFRFKMTDDAYDYRRILPKGTIRVECGASGDCLFQSFAYALGDRSGTLHLNLDNGLWNI